ncbi:hypothetical protein F5878DRAFT_664349 [Lentinula raphanica]|uniref:Uncharacterized protein n=1 Tax=Lentinula raphanica TaxID=153919 RepID=A0AA38P2G8_9AGAR|nr:hypothetical protein F5878DRAFT_664349 [Lentinula raphanica]
MRLRSLVALSSMSLFSFICAEVSSVPVIATAPTTATSLTPTPTRTQTSTHPDALQGQQIIIIFTCGGKALPNRPTKGCRDKYGSHIKGDPRAQRTPDYEAAIGQVDRFFASHTVWTGFRLNRYLDPRDNKLNLKEVGHPHPTIDEETLTVRIRGIRGVCEYKGDKRVFVNENEVPGDTRPGDIEAVMLRKHPRRIFRISCLSAKSEKREVILSRGTLPSA